MVAKVRIEYVSRPKERFRAEGEIGSNDVLAPRLHDPVNAPAHVVEASGGAFSVNAAPADFANGYGLARLTVLEEPVIVAETPAAAPVAVTQNTGTRLAVGVSYFPVAAGNKLALAAATDAVG